MCNSNTLGTLSQRHNPSGEKSLVEYDPVICGLHVMAAYVCTLAPQFRNFVYIKMACQPHRIIIADGRKTGEHALQVRTSEWEQHEANVHIGIYELLAENVLPWIMFPFPAGHIDIKSLPVDQWPQADPVYKLWWRIKDSEAIRPEYSQKRIDAVGPTMYVRKPMTLGPIWYGSTARSVNLCSYCVAWAPA